MKKSFLSIMALIFLASCSEVEQQVSDNSCFTGDGKTYKWNMVTTWPKNFPGLGMAAENFSQSLEQIISSHKKVYGAGELPSSSWSF